MKLIPLTKGMFAKVDDADFDWLMQWKWQAHRSRIGTSYYAIRNGVRINGKRNGVKMHRAIMDAPFGVMVDHEDHDGLNNQRSNLRMASSGQNKQNSYVSKKNVTGYKGVSLDKRSNKFWAQINVSGKIIYLGTYLLPEQAALAYDEAALKYFGEFAMTNKAQGLLKDLP